MPVSPSRHRACRTFLATIATAVIERRSAHRGPLSAGRDDFEQDAGGVRHLPDTEGRNRGEARALAALPFQATPHSARQRLVETEILPHGDRSTLLADRLAAVGTASIADVEIDELPEPLSVAMLDGRLGPPHDRPAPHSPAVAEVSLLGTGPRKALVEATEFQEPLPRAQVLLLARKYRSSA